MKKLTKKRINEIKSKYKELAINKSLITKLNKAILDVERYIQKSEYLKNSFLWDGIRGADNRRRFENKHYFHEEIELIDTTIDLVINVSCSCNNIYVTKNTMIKDLKAELKKNAEVLYVISFDKHKHIIEKIDSLVNNANSLNDNKILFDRCYYDAKVGFMPSKRQGVLSSDDKKKLEEYRAKRAAQSNFTTLL